MRRVRDMLGARSAHGRCGLGACPRFILLALVFVEVLMSESYQGSTCSVLDALERWCQGGVGCTWWRCLIGECNGRWLDALER